MLIFLHEEHQHTETASSALSSMGSELVVAAVVGMMLGILLLGYAIKQRQN